MMILYCIVLYYIILKLIGQTRRALCLILSTPPGLSPEGVGHIIILHYIILCYSTL